MNMEGEQRIAAPRQKVWEALNDPEVLRASIPGCQSLTREADDRFTATVEVKVGPISARFNGVVSLADLDPPNSYRLNLEGNGGISGSVKGSARVRLSDDGDGTLVSYDVDAQVGGRMAQLGGPILDATAKRLAGKFFSRFEEVVTGKAAASAATESPDSKTAAPATTTGAAPTATTGFPAVWVLATVVALLVGFLVGRGLAAPESDWMGVALGLLLIVVAGAAFEYGRRAAAPVIMLDNEVLQRLSGGGKR